jgi:hypothetical protein
LGIAFTTASSFFGCFLLAAAVLLAYLCFASPIRSWISSGFGVAAGFCRRVCFFELVPFFLAEPWEQRGGLQPEEIQLSNKTLRSLSPSLVF